MYLWFSVFEKISVKQVINKLLSCNDAPSIQADTLPLLFWVLILIFDAGVFTFLVRISWFNKIPDIAFTVDSGVDNCFIFLALHAI